jgi:hypothetical protein
MSSRHRSDEPSRTSRFPWTSVLSVSGVSGAFRPVSVGLVAPSFATWACQAVEEAGVGEVVGEQVNVRAKRERRGVVPEPDLHLLRV